MGFDNIREQSLLDIAPGIHMDIKGSLKRHVETPSILENRGTL